MTQGENWQVPDHLNGERLDKVLSELLPDYSRSRLQQWIKQGLVTVDDEARRPRDKVYAGDLITFQREEALAQLEEGDWQPQAIHFETVYEDEQIIVVNKPVGLVVHPGAGNPEGTLVNALLHHTPALARLPRAGIVHRLDKETSGLLVVARTLEAHTSLVEQLQARAFEREYRAIVYGVLTAGGTVDAPIGRHPRQRTRQAVVNGGKEAVTHYRVLERFRAHSFIKCMLETGRTHQIRVHMAHLHHPLVGDPLYGGRLKIPAGATPLLAEALRGFKRQALHAMRLGLTHPATGEFMSWEAPLPADMERLLEILREDASQA